MRWPVLLTLVLATAACDDMNQQRRYDSYEQSSLFANGTSLQAPPEGAVARDDVAWAAALRDRPPMTIALLQRGRERYGIYCTPCHDAAGHGHGVVPSRGFPAPPDFHQPRLRTVASSYLVNVIGRGHGVMYGYADRVPPADRWAIAGYIRALQLSQDAPLAMLSTEDRMHLPGPDR